MKAVHRALATLLAAAIALGYTNARAQIPGVSAIQGDTSRTLFGPGTGVTIGFVDSGVNSAHPSLTGNDSLGNPRLVAQANFVTSEPGNTGQDVAGHGTSVSSAAISSDASFTGLAPDARYINARVLDSNDSFLGNAQVMNGVGFAVSSGADIVNLSLNFDSPNNNGNNTLDLMLDWAASTMGVNFTVSAGNINAHRDANGFVVLDENPPRPVRSPASAYNVVAVGRTGTPPGNPLGPITGSPPNLVYNQVFITSASGPVDSPSGTSNRDKPDVVAPGTAETLANANFQSQGNLWTTGLNGTSFSAPMVAGMMAQQIGYGRAHNLSTNPLVIKATLMNSADHVLEKNGSPWQPAGSTVVGGVLQVTSPLDTDSGAGQINGVKLFHQYSAGQWNPGLVNPTGWDLHTMSGLTPIDYNINSQISAGNILDVTLNWNRHVTWTDNGDGIPNGADNFVQTQALSNLDLTVLLDGTPVAKSMSTVDNVEHFSFLLTQAGDYTIEVDRLDVPGSPSDELYGLAWNVSAVPEPAAIFLAAVGFAAIYLRSFRRSRVVAIA